MSQSTRVGPFLVRMVTGLVVLVAIYLAITGLRNSVNHPLVPKEKLIAELNAINPPDKSIQIGSMSFVDRETFYYATKSYSSSESIGKITAAYIALLQTKGWRYISPYAPGDNSSEFCKGELLGTISFLNGDEKPVRYSVQLTSGGTETRTCN
jgi:hypothetical protein